jgi:hypothetical protein
MANQENPTETLFTSADGSKYNIDKLTYPLDLVGNYSEYGESMILFNINVLEESKLGKGPEDTFVKDFTPSYRGELIGAAYSTARVTATAIASGAITGAGVSSFAGENAFGGAALGAGVNAVAGATVLPKSGKFTRPVKRLKTAIALHMPNQLQIRYGMNWQDKEMLTETAAVEATNMATLAGGIAGGAIAKGLGNSPAAGAAIGAGIGATVANPTVTAALALQSVPGGEFMQAGSGVAVNPKKEQTFKGVDFRTFNINYEFYPRDADEARNVLNIIYQFKYHMHPEYKDGTTFLFVYPSEFDVFYYKGKGLNKSIHKHTSCVLADMTVNYTPNGQFATFADGTPTQINIQLTFRELGVLTKDKIKEGL